MYLYLLKRIPVVISVVLPSWPQQVESVYTCFALYDSPLSLSLSTEEHNQLPDQVMMHWKHTLTVETTPILVFAYKFSLRIINQSKLIMSFTRTRTVAYFAGS